MRRKNVSIDEEVGDREATRRILKSLLAKITSDGHATQTEEEIAVLLTEAEEDVEVLRQAVKTAERFREKAEQRLFGQKGKDERWKPKEVASPNLPNPPMVLGQLQSPVGDVNFLLDRVLTTAPLVSGLLKNVILDLIQRTDGLFPDVLGVFDIIVDKFRPQSGEPRFVVRWKLERPPRVQDSYGLWEIVRKIYGQEIRGPKTQGKGWETVAFYHDLKDNTVPKKHGLYFGPDSTCQTGSRGVVVVRQFKRESEFRYLKDLCPEDWLARTIDGSPVKVFEVELREGGGDFMTGPKGLEQSEFISLVVQVSYFLKHDAILDSRSLAVAVYRALNRLGAENTDRAKLYGLSGVLEVIERVILLPLERPELAQVYGFEPESLLLVGVPGVGKTLLAKFLMAQEYNTIFAAVEADRLLTDLTNPAGSSFLHRIDEIGARAKLPVILLIDDIDVLMRNDEKDNTAIVSKLLNIFQGVRQKGFYVLASTNNPERIDPRLLEPGRLSKLVHVPLPDENDRKGILNLLFEDKSLPFANNEEREEIAAVIAGETDGWTGRYLKELVFEAGRLISLQVTGRVKDGGTVVPESLPPLTLDHFIRAKKLVLDGVDMDKFKREDEILQKFISQKGGMIGFIRNQ